jgi:hypothetical protein
MGPKRLGPVPNSTTSRLRTIASVTDGGWGSVGLGAGMILGGLLVPHESELMRIASNDARFAISLPNGAAPTAWR